VRAGGILSGIGRGSRFLLLGFSDLLATRWSFHSDVTPNCGACDFSSIVQRNDRLAVDKKWKVNASLQVILHVLSSLTARVTIAKHLY